MPGFPFGKRCVVFMKGNSSAMECRKRTVMATTWSRAQLGSLPQNRAAVEKESAVCVDALMMQPM